MKMRYFFYMLLLLLAACTTTKKAFYGQGSEGWAEQSPPSASPAFQLFLIGDAGKPSLNPLEPTFRLLQQDLEKATERSAVVFLGDNLYPHGLHGRTADSREQEEKYLMAQIDLLRQFKGRGFFIPGNHDWANGRGKGWQNLRNQQRFITNALQNEAVFYPKHGCPGPVELPLSEDLVLIVVDTQWWLHGAEKPGEDADCEAKTDDELLIQLEGLVRKNKHKHVVVVGHHPMYSVGTHGGNAPPQTHIFPLTDIKKDLYVPLPVLGSVYYFYRTVVGNIQDLPHPRYKRMQQAMTEIFKSHPNLIYACGHDHNLQYQQRQGVHYVVSGAGSKRSYVANKPKKAAFAMSDKGYASLGFYADGSVWLQFRSPSDSGEGRLVFSKRLYQTDFGGLANAAEEVPEFSNREVAAAATQSLAAKGLKKAVLGENYRKEWRAIIDHVPVFDIGSEQGGLKIVKKGGGMQTRSLRLEAKNGKQYVLRSIEKYPEKAVPPMLRGTVGEDIVRDQISGSHPYAAFVLPPLAEAAGVYHTNPKLVYLPDDPRLGAYRDDFAKGLYLFEERADDGFWEDAPHFGSPKDIDSTPTVLENIREDNDDLINQEQVLRSRLFDLWISDWDRHDDQWRWAEFKDKEKDVKYYAPIPRDRDQAFFDAGGLLMNVGTRKWGLRKFQGFKEDIRDPEGMGFNARYFDRSFLTEPDKQDWMREVQQMQNALTDSVIEAAIKQFPPEIYALHGEEIIQKLKKRRDYMQRWALDFYHALAKRVDITGSDKHELFKIERLNDIETRVRVWKVKKKDRDKKHKMYDRTFRIDETKEIRLWGFDGEDEFEFEGEVNKGIKVRAIGGEDEDKFDDDSEIKAWGKENVIYDNALGNEIEFGPDTKDKTSFDPTVNDYERKSFVYDYLGPQAFFSFNPDDGVFVGGGVLLKKYGFRKSPYQALHSVKFNLAPKTLSSNFVYNAEFIDLLGKGDLLLEADMRLPSFVDFFYGSGNETPNLRDQLGNQYYRVRYNQFIFRPEMRWNFSAGKQTVKVGGFFQYIELEEQDDEDSRFLYDYAALPEVDAEDLLDNAKGFTAFLANYRYDSRDDATIPTRGFTLQAEAARVSGSDEQDRQEINFTRLNAEMALYLSTGDRFRITLATRVGAETIIGDYEAVFQSSTLGGLSNLRGYRRMRFAGDRSAYLNTELRIKLFNFRSYLFPGQFGINGFYDRGRVWLEGEDSDLWHQGYGGGIWFTPYQATVITLELSSSEEENLLPFVRFGFMF